ncbi:MAG TPA: DUF3185 domain-containing protein [Phycisphaerae bacterium]|nr:DUF3185 domain-containing protein [Phycisphaerae bacterium]
MDKSSALVIGMVLIVLGLVGLGWNRITYFEEDTIVDVGPVRVTATEEKEIPLAPILGGVAVAGGVALLVTGARKT